MNSDEKPFDVDVGDRRHAILSADSKLTSAPAHDPKTVIIESEKTDKQK